MAQLWYIESADGREGPLTSREFQDRATAGSLRPTDRVSPDGRRWAVAARVKGLTFPSPPRSPSTAQCDVVPFGLDLPGYAIEAVVGSGGCGVVYRARQAKLDRVVALKTVRLGTDARPTLLARFEQEAVVLARFQHPNIVGIHDFGYHNGQVFLVMEFLTGEDLSSRIERTGRLDEPTAWAVARQTAVALAHAAGHGIIHRDIKPANLFLVPAPTGFGSPDDRPMVKVTDFGLAFTRRADSAEDVRLTQAGVVVGTPAYMAPEQFGKSGIDHRADIYALGATVFHALNGEPPFVGPTIWDVMLRKVEAPPRLRAEASPESARLVADMMATNPDERIGSYGELIERIDRLACVQEIAARTVGPVARRVGFRRLAWVGLVGCGIAAATAVWAGRPGAGLRPVAGPTPRLEVTGEVETLFDRRNLLGWRSVQGAELDRDAEGATVLTTAGEVSRPYRISPDYRLCFGIDLHRAAVAEVGFLVVPGERGPATRYAVRITRGGAVFGKREGDGAFQPLSEAVPYPSAEELRGRVPYQEVKVQRAGDRWDVTFNDRLLSAFKFDPSATPAGEVSVRVEGGAVRVESVAVERLRAAK